MSILDIDPADIPLPANIPANTNSGESLVWLTWCLLVVTTLVLAARVSSKLFILKRFALDDVMMLAAWAITVGYSASVQMAYHYGVGRHYMYLTIMKSYHILMYEYVAQTLSVASPAISRTAFTFYLLSLLGKSRTSLRWILWTTLTLHAVFNLALVITMWTVCGFNMVVILDPTLTCFKKSPTSDFAHFAGAFNAFTDMVLTVVPAILIFRLRTTTRAKYAATALLGLSCLAMVCAIWRTAEIDDVFTQNWDFTHDTVPYFWASSLEQNIILISASIPTIGPLLKHLRRNYEQRSTKHGSLSSSGARLSGDSAEIQHNLAHALGIHMPGLGNHVVITGGQDRKSRRNTTTNGNGEDDELPLTDITAIKTTVRTDVKVDTIGDGDDDEKFYSRYGRL